MIKGHSLQMLAGPKGKASSPAVELYLYVRGTLSVRSETSSGVRQGHHNKTFKYSSTSKIACFTPSEQQEFIIIRICTHQGLIL